MSPALRSTRPSAARRARHLTHVAAALLLLAGGRAAGAQADVVLRDADAPALVALLRADVARMEAMQGQVAAVAGQVRKEFQALERDAADPLAYVKARTAHYLVPPDARYAAACSRAVSAYMMGPRAVFAIGRTDDATVDALRQKGTTALSQREMYDLMMRQAGGSAGQAQAATMRFYQARGFTISGTVAEAAPLRWGGATPDALAISVHMTNAVATQGEDCAALGNTAVLILMIDGKAAPARRASPVDAADDAFEATLARVGMTRDRYSALLGALWQAQKEMDDPHEAEQTDAMGRIPDLRAMAEARRQNRGWLQRHRDDVLPVLQQYGRALGG